jgi:prepilin-type N-terminal cleavage/methylation domain-containing protein
MNEQGFSLLESVFAMLILSVAIACTVPVWSSIHKQQQLSSKMSTASRLGVEQIERLIAGSSTASARHGEQQTPYQVSVHSHPDQAGQRVDVQVSFSDRGKTYAVDFQAVVPRSHLR